MEFNGFSSLILNLPLNFKCDSQGGNSNSIINSLNKFSSLFLGY